MGLGPTMPRRARRLAALRSDLFRHRVAVERHWNRESSEELQLLLPGRRSCEVLGVSGNQQAGARSFHWRTGRVLECCTQSVHLRAYVDKLAEET